MQEYGTVTAQIVTSAAQIPIPGATLTITQELPDGRQELLAVRMTNYDGFTEPFDVPTPPLLHLKFCLRQAHQLTADDLIFQ